MSKDLLIEVGYSKRFVLDKEWVIIDKVSVKNGTNFIYDPNYISIMRSLNSVIGEELFTNLDELKRHLTEIVGLDLNCLSLINKEEQIKTLEQFKARISPFNPIKETTKTVLCQIVLVDNKIDK